MVHTRPGCIRRFALPQAIFNVCVPCLSDYLLTLLLGVPIPFAGRGLRTQIDPPFARAYGNDPMSAFAHWIFISHRLLLVLHVEDWLDHSAVAVCPCLCAFPTSGIRVWVPFVGLSAQGWWHG